MRSVPFVKRGGDLLFVSQSPRQTSEEKRKHRRDSREKKIEKRCRDLSLKAVQDQIQSARQKARQSRDRRDHASRRQKQDRLFVRIRTDGIARKQKPRRRHEKEDPGSQLQNPGDQHIKAIVHPGSRDASRRNARGKRKARQQSKACIPPPPLKRAPLEAIGHAAINESTALASHEITEMRAPSSPGSVLFLHESSQSPEAHRDPSFRCKPRLAPKCLARHSAFAFLRFLHFIMINYIQKFSICQVKDHLLYKFH